MATKYVPKDDATPAIRGAAPRKSVPAAQQWPQGRNALIYTAFAFFMFCFMLALSFQEAAQFHNQPILRGKAVVAAKARADDGSPVLRLKLPLHAGRWTEATAPAPERYWKQFQEGDPVAVLFQRSRFGHSIRVHEIGLMPLTAAPSQPRAAQPPPES